MSAEAPVPLDGNTDATTDEAALAHVSESNLPRLAGGVPADFEGLIAFHPELALLLRAWLKFILAMFLRSLSFTIRESEAAASPPTDPTDRTHRS